MHSEKLTIEQLAGQRMMIGFDGLELTTALKTCIDTFHVGGIVLFARNISTPEQVRALCHSAQNYAASCDQPPLLIGIDQEGGQVARLKRPFTEFEGNPAMRGIADARRFGRICAQELAQIGVNMNFAPVMDVAFDRQTSVMADRSFGSDARWVSDLGCIVIDELQRRGTMAVAKHFPGIGRTRLDSHIEQPVCSVDAGLLQSSDLIPFADAIASTVAGIMLSHIVFENLDPQWPASLSSKIARNLLRRQMGYAGVVMTDDLDMGAIKKHYQIDTVVDRILAAEIDLALICHQGPDIQKAYEAFLARLSTERHLRQLGRASAARILALKRQYLGPEASLNTHAGRGSIHRH